MSSQEAQERIYLGGKDGMALRLGRAEHTVRQWLRSPDFPDELKPEREGGRGKIYWTVDQVQGLEQYADEREQRRGWQPAA